MSAATLDSTPPAVSPAAQPQPRILISILNWNGASKTLACLASLQRERAVTSAAVTTLVIDNGSREDDAVALQSGIGSSEVVVKRLSQNLGFTGGHNVAIRQAIDEGYDYIWLLNNDATVEPGTLQVLVSEMEQHPRCGAISPILRDADDGTIARCVSTHDWQKRTSRRILTVEEAERIQSEQPASVWVDGTAVLFRVKALEDTGGLDDRLFAYYDDNDIGARLAAKGWFSRCAFSATVIHENKKRIEDFPLYLSYLLPRNEMLFWYTNTPAAYRSLIRLRMADRALFDANKLRKNGFAAHADAALLGIYDFFRGHFGAPRHQGKVPLVMRAASQLSRLMYALK